MSSVLTFVSSSTSVTISIHSMSLPFKMQFIKVNNESSGLHSPARPFLIHRSLSHSINHQFARPFSHSLTRQPTRSINQSPVLPIIHWLAYLLPVQQPLRTDLVSRSPKLFDDLVDLVHFEFVKLTHGLLQNL